MTQVDSPNFLQCVLDWLRAGYPHGVPPKDYFPLLALLQRSLTEEQTKLAALEVLKAGDPDVPVTTEALEQAIREVTEKRPNPEEINQVAARLAAVGWPLAATVRES